MKTYLNNRIKITLFTSLLVLSVIYQAIAQSPKYTIYMDVAHHSKFWDDPNDMQGKDQNQVQRVKYMTDQLLKNASAFNANLKYLKSEITDDQLDHCDLLFIHIPSSKYSTSEIKAITNYLKNGGTMFLTMDVDYWSTLDQTNVNDLIDPFGIQYGSDSPDTLSGGYTKAGLLTDKALKVTYHGGRIVKGGTPFCFNNQTEDYPFGVFKELENGGKLVVMGDGMVSLYMTSWAGVDDYQCHEFMDEVLGWLLEE